MRAPAAQTRWNLAELAEQVVDQTKLLQSTLLAYVELSKLLDAERLNAAGDDREQRRALARLMHSINLEASRQAEHLLKTTTTLRDQVRR